MATTNEIKVTPIQLKNKASDLKTLNSKFKGYLETLESTETKLNTMWDGQANDEFHKAFTSDVKQMHKFYDLIDKYVNTMNDIASNYEKAENANTTTATTRSYS